MRAFFLITVLGLVGTLALLAQQSMSQPTFRTSVDVVQIDVSVVDKDRRPVQGLTTADFTILEDGKPRPIVAFVPVELAEPEKADAPAGWTRDVAPDVVTNAVKPEGRLVVIMFDWSIRFEDQLLAKRIAAAAVDQLGPNDLAAVIFTSQFSNGGTPQNFTADRGRLLAAINQPFAVVAHNPPKGNPFHDPRNKNEVMIDDPEGYESGDCYCRICVPEAIARVADAVRDVRGRKKTLLFIGTYVRLFESLQGPTTRQGPEFRPGINGLPVVHPGVCGSYLKDARAKMDRATSLANLTIHTIDPVGNETDGNSPMGGSIIGQTDRRDDLAALADTTGGRAVMNTNTPESLMPALFAESHSYYLLAFTPADLNTKGKFHKIEVKVNRSGVNVRTRAGYYTGETRVKGAAPNLLNPETAAALEGILPRTDVLLSVGVAPFAMQGREESAVAVVLGVRHQPMMSDRSGSNQPVRVLAAAFDRHGRSVQSEEQTVGVALPPNGAGDVPYEVLSRLALKPGRYEIRAALDAGSTARASVYTYVDVPDFVDQPLSLSGVVIATSPAPPSAPLDAFKDLLPIVPTARREFERTSRASVFVRAYQRVKDPPQPVNMTAQIQDTSGRVLMKDAATLDAAQFAANHAADYRIALPIERLNPGEYLLNLEAVQGQHSARRAVRFAVR